MDYTNLNTYKIQAKYNKKIYEMKINEIDYVNKIKELCKLAKVYESVFDFGLGNMVFLWGYRSIGLRLGVFYVVVYESFSGSIMWVLVWVFRWV